MPRLAPQRTDDAPPHCRHFGVCGGCSLLDQPIAWQIQEKVDAAQQLLAPFLNGITIQHQLPPRTPLHFRTRLLYPVRANSKGHAAVGLYEFHTNELVRIEECRTQDRWLTEFGLHVERVLRDVQVQPFDPKRRTGMVMAVWARLASGTGEVAAGVVTRPGLFQQGAMLAEGLQNAAAAIDVGGRPKQLVGVVHSISERDDEFLLGERHTPLRGRDHVIDRRDGLQFRISAGSFYQIHAGSYALLYAPAMAMCGDVRGQRVIDGYGGVGAFGLRLAKAGAAQVLIVEDNAAACRDAEHNAKVNDLPNVTVQRTAFAGATLPQGVDLCVVDPPRSGLQSAGVAVVLRAAPRRVLHVACSVDALARDLGELTAGGYRVTAVRVCDLFPHTEHVEVLTMLERRT